MEIRNDYNTPMQYQFSPNQDFAARLDQEDPLASFRARFLIHDPGMIYMDGNSLGRLSVATMNRLQNAVELEWGRQLVTAWGKNWWEAPSRVGEKIALLIGATSGQVIVCDSVSVNLYKLAAAALSLHPARLKIVTDTLNFPSDLYILQGLVRLLGDHHEIIRIGSSEDDITPDLDALAAAIDENTALVTLSHVVFKSGYLYDLAAITEMAHRRGALVLWDLSHSVGVVPISLDESQVDFAVGCTYKYLNGGPGSPAFLYVRRDLQDQVSSPINGWWGQKTPFDLELDYQPAVGITRFLTGTPPVLSLLAMEAALAPIIEAGLEHIRRKSILMTEYLVYLFDAVLAPLGFSLGSPRSSDRRGSHISICHPEGYRINRALIDEMNLIPDFRDPDNIRLGLVPIYTTYSEIWEAVRRINLVVEEERYLKYSSARQVVT
jgi:kynureninase